jgi:hypothetical protein
LRSITHGGRVWMNASPANAPNSAAVTIVQ